MFQMFNINFSNMYKKENSAKFMIIGVLLIGFGVLSFINKGIGIKLLSFAFSLLLLFFAYLNLKNINELRRYAPKEEIKPFIGIQCIFLISAILLIVFPTKIQIFISSIFGIYIIYSQIINLIRNKNNPYYRFGTFNLIKVIFGFILIFSPFFLSRFIVSILSLILILIGFSILSVGNKLKNIDIL